jgi:ParB family chromosome partitioning protein
VHHPKPQKRSQSAGDNAKWKAEQDKQRREEAISNATGIRVLAAIGDVVPVRLMKRDLLFVVERLAGMLDENRLAILAKQHGIRKAKDSDSITKLFATFLRRAEESMLGRLAVELTIVFTASRGNALAMLKEAAAVYKVDTDAIAAKVRQEFAAKEKAKSAKKAPAKATPAKLEKTA